MESINRAIVCGIIILLLMPLVYADLEATREIQKKEILVGESLTVSIKITNQGESESVISIKEQLSPDVELIEPLKPTYTISKAKIPIFVWNKKLAPKETLQVGYTIKPQLLGKFSILPTTITDESKNELYFTEIATITVLCRADGSCAKQENYINCPSDCPSGSSDNVCDFKRDGMCDPDCESEADKDCAQEGEKKKNNMGAQVQRMLLNHPTLTLLFGVAAIFLILAGVLFLFPKREPKV